QIVDRSVSEQEIARDPFAVVEAQETAANPAIVSPLLIFGQDRLNAKGWDLTDPLTVAEIERGRGPFVAPHQWTAAPMTPAKGCGPVRQVVNPARLEEVVGTVTDADAAQVKEAVAIAA